MYKIFKNIPSDWQACKFGDLIISSQNGMYKHLKYYGKGTPIIRINDFDKEGNFVSNSFQRVILEKKEVTLYKLDSRNILINRVNSLSHIGKVAFIEKLFESTVFESNMIRIVVNEKKLLPEYAFLYLLTDFAMRQFRRKAKRAVAQASINQKDIRAIIIVFPRKINEQQKIIQIYNNLKKIIISTQKIINHLQIIKKGLMQRLFTQGIGRTEFKEKRFGKIPKEWEVNKLKNLIKYEKGKKPNSAIEKYKEGYLPYLSAEYLRNGTDTVYLEPSDYLVQSDYDNFILIWDGSNAGSFFFGQKGIISSTMVKINIKSNRVIKDFLYYFCKFKEREIRRQTRGTGIPHVDKLVFQNLKIPIPTIIEQNKIASILINIDKEIINEKNYLKSLKKNRRGLMQDLLTGKKRVKLET